MSHKHFIQFRSFHSSRLLLTLFFVALATGCSKDDATVESPKVGDVVIKDESIDIVYTANTPNISDIAITADSLGMFSSQGNIAAVKLLLEAGIDVNARTSAGSIALVEASWMGRHEVVSYLIEKNADINIASSTNITALSAAISQKHEGVALLLIAHGANPNLVDAAGSTPLIEAAWQGNLPLVRALLASGANVNFKRSGDRVTPLKAAYDRPDVVQVLKAAGAKK